MTSPEWKPVPGFPGARMIDSETHPPIFASDIAAAEQERQKHLARKARRIAPTEVDQGMPRSEAGESSPPDPASSQVTASDPESGTEVGVSGDLAHDRSHATPGVSS